MISCTVLVLSVVACSDNEGSGTTTSEDEGNSGLVGFESNGFVTTRRITKDGQGNIERDFSYQIDMGNNQIGRIDNLSSDGAERERTYIYDDNGYLVQSDTYNSEGNITKRRIYSHNEDGYLIEQTVQDFVNSNENENRIFNFDSQNKLIGKIYRSASSGETNILYAYEYDTQGLLAQKPRHIIKMDNQTGSRSAPASTIIIIARAPGIPISILMEPSTLDAN